MTTDIQSAALLAKHIETARGMMLGLALGDSWTTPHSPDQLRRAGVATQLTCATVDGLIRSLERAATHGHPLANLSAPSRASELPPSI